MIERFAEHIEKLCKQHHITYRVMLGCRPVAYPVPRLIHIKPIDSDIEYAEALHEIGHVVLCHDPGQPRPWKELLAWRWAYQQSLQWSQEMELFRRWALGCWKIEPETQLCGLEKILVDEMLPQV